MPDRALVLFSGGQDSTTCLAWALDRFDHVETVGFDYGQRHRVELDCRANIVASLKAHYPDWAAKLGEDHTVDLGVRIRSRHDLRVHARAAADVENVGRTQLDDGPADEGRHEGSRSE